MSIKSKTNDDLIERATNGDTEALGELFTRYRGRLKQMVDLRLDRRIQRRVDPSDVVQEAFLDASRRLQEYSADPKIPLFLWMRMLTGQRLTDIHRQHLGAGMRDARKELKSYQVPTADLTALTELLVGKITTASQAVQRAELRVLLGNVLAEMDPIDREILALRHFEMLTNGECAQVLDINPTTSSKRYIRALKRVKKNIDEEPGLSDYYTQR